jgi:hypothetical protein
VEQRPRLVVIGLPRRDQAVRIGRRASRCGREREARLISLVDQIDRDVHLARIGAGEVADHRRFHERERPALADPRLGAPERLVQRPLVGHWLADGKRRLGQHVGVRDHARAVDVDRGERWRVGGGVRGSGREHERKCGERCSHDHPCKRPLAGAFVRM